MISRHDGATTLSAYDRPAPVYATRSPTATSVTPSPTSTTMPEPSPPGMMGSVGLFAPERTYTSM